MLTSIAGLSVVVTGASKGIGKGIATVFCQNGGNVLAELAMSGLTQARQRRTVAARSILVP